MSGESYIKPLCDTHPDDDAQALCKYHKKLLCLSCVLEKSTECSITVLQKISSNQEKALLECLLVRQKTVEKKRLIDEHENKTGALKNELKQQVTELHEKLVSRLNEMKESCTYSIDIQADAVIAQNKNSKQLLDTLEKAITDNVEKLSGESIDDLSDVQTKLNEAKAKVLTEEIHTDLDGEFSPNKSLEDFILQSGNSLGKVYLKTEQHYLAINARTNDKLEDDIQENKQPQLFHIKQGDGVAISNDSEIHQKSEYTASDEYDTKQGKQVSPAVSAADESEKTTESSKEEQDKINPKQSKKKENKTDTTSQEVKAEKIGFFKGIFSKRKSDPLVKQETETETRVNPTMKQTSSVQSNGTENIYQDINFATSGNTQPRYLINKTITIAGMQQYFKSACKFSKVVNLGAGFIGLLSRAHNSVVLTNLDGKYFAKKTLPGLTNIVAVGKEEIATIVQNRLQVTQFKVSRKGFSTMAGFVVNAELPKITGFDFDQTSSQYAISLPGKLVILDKNGKTLKERTCDLGKTSFSDEVVTTYDFHNDCLYTLNIQNENLKCFSFAKGDAIWRRKFEGQLNTPRNLYLYKDKLCVSSGDAIGLFSANNGTPILKHDTKDVLDDCFGMCVIDDVILFSSNSTDFDTSTQIAFISV